MTAETEPKGMGMIPLTIGLGVAAITAAILTLTTRLTRGGWRNLFAGLTVLGVVASTSVAAAPVASASPPSSGDSWAGYVATSYTNCEWVQTWIDYNDYQHPGEPFIATYASVDGGTNCALKTYGVRPQSLQVGQDLLRLDPYPSTYWRMCNHGGQYYNGTLTHSIYTEYGFPARWDGQAVCGNGDYKVQGNNFYNPIPGGGWYGGYNSNAWETIIN